MVDHSSRGSRPAVLVTGAASGIGRATAEMFLDRGAQVAAVDCQWDVLARETLSRALVLEADVSVEDDCIATFSKVNEAFGPIDTLVNCAGITRRSSIIDTTAQEWDRVINVNLRSVYLMSRQALKMMLPRKRGSIVNVASGWGLAGGARAAAYCASKGGVVLLTKAMALDHGPDGIRINCVCPGDTDTPVLRFRGRVGPGASDREFRTQVERAFHALEVPVYHYEGTFSKTERCLNASAAVVPSDQARASAMEASLREHLPGWQVSLQVNPASMDFLQFSPSPKTEKLTSC